MDTAAQVRRRRILDELRSQGTTRVVDLAMLLHVSDETIRRDLTALAAQGLVGRTYGVAEPLEAGAYESDLSARESHHSDIKQAIATETVRHIGNASTIFLDEGYTTELIARALPADRALTIVTAAAPIASLLAERPRYQVFLTGGRVRGNTLACVDEWAVRMVRAHSFDLAIIGANGISRREGLTTPDPAVAAVKAAAIECARRRIFFGLHTKFGVASFARFGRIEDLSLIVTDRALSSTEARRYEEMGPEVVRV